jgi:hypothetical protein
VFFIASVTVSFNVMLGEIEVMKSFAITDWQKSFFTFVFGAIAIATPVIIPATVVIKKTQLSRWLSVGVTLSALLLIYELFAIDHIVLRTGMDSSDVHKQNSLAHRALEATLDKISPADKTIVVDAGTDNANQVLSLSNDLAAQQKSLALCKRSDYACKKQHKAEVKSLNTKLSAYSTVQTEQHESHKEKMESVNAALELQKMADSEDGKIVASPAFRMLSSDNQTALFYQLVFSHFVAVLITLFNTLSMMIVGGLAASLGFGEKVKTYLQEAPLPRPTKTEVPNTEQPRSWSDRYNAGEVSAWSGLFSGKSEQQNVNREQVVTAQSVNREPAFTPDREPVFTHGHAEIVNDEAIAFEFPVKETPRRPIGFAAWDIEEPVKKITVNLKKNVNREQVFTPDCEPAFTPECEPESVNREQADRQQREHQKSFADLADEIVNGTYFRARKVSLRGVKEFMACRTEIAREFRNRLINEQIISESGEVI